MPEITNINQHWARYGERGIKPTINAFINGLKEDESLDLYIYFLLGNRKDESLLSPEILQKIKDLELKDFCSEQLSTNKIYSAIEKYFDEKDADINWDEFKVGGSI